MAELTSTKIYGDLEVVRAINTNTLMGISSDEIDINTDSYTAVTLNAAALQLISGVAESGSYGVVVRDSALPTTDYQYLYWNNSSNYGGMFNRQGTSNSDLRQEYNYLRWYTSTAGGDSTERFYVNLTEFGSDCSINGDQKINVNNFNEDGINSRAIVIAGTTNGGNIGMYAYGASHSGTFQGQSTANAALLYSGGNTSKLMMYSPENMYFFTATGKSFIFNEDSLDIDFRVESNTNTHAIFVDSANSFMGMNLSTPNCTLNLGGSFRIDDSAERPNAGTGLEFYYDNSIGYIHPYDRTGAHYAGSAMDIRGTDIILRGVLGSATRQNAVIGYNAVVINQDAADVDFRVESLAPNDYAFYVRGSDAKVGMGEMTTETEATYKMLNLRFYEANSTAKLTSVGAVSSNDGMLIYNDYTVTGHASIDFVVDDNYPTTYNAGRFGWYGYGTTSTSNSYNYFFWTGYSGSAHWETMRLHRLGNLYVRADVVAYSTVITSDERLKKNVENLDNVLDKLMQLRPVSFEWKDETKRGDERVSGLIAQEVEEIFPELISESPNLGNGLDEEQDETEYKHVRYNELIPYLTKGMQEQQQIINNQQKEIDDLKQKEELLMEKL